MQNFSFCGSGWLFGTFFWHFFVIFSCKNSVFCEAGRSFCVKKDNFFHAKLKFLRGWVVFLSKKNSIFLRFFRKCRRRPSVGEPGGPKRARANSRRESRVGEAGRHHHRVQAYIDQGGKKNERAKVRAHKKTAL